MCGPHLCSGFGLIGTASDCCVVRLRTLFFNSLLFMPRILPAKSAAFSAPAFPIEKVATGVPEGI